MVHIGIIGLPLSGKTTLFRALTGAEVAVSQWAGGKKETHVGVAKVPDERLDFLHAQHPNLRKVSATVEYIDIAGFERGISQSEAFITELSTHLRNVDALVLVIRAFQDEHIPHPEGRIDPLADLELVQTEFLLTDLSIVERRKEKLERQIQKRKDERDQRELDLLKRCLEALEVEKPLRELEFTPEEEKILRGYQFLTAKPLLIVLNIHESDIGKEEEILAPFETFGQQPKTRVLTASAEIEMEIAQLNPEDAEAFRKDLGIQESARNRLIRESYQLLDLISFFTIGKEEVRAWTIRKGTVAQKAAGEVHTDMERGFIRAEVVHFEDFRQHGSMAKCREVGVLRLEGRDYVVQDGDIILFRFHV